MLMFNSGLSIAQLSITNDGTPPDNSAMLDVKSGNKGVLIPRMTNLGIHAILSPADGLMVYCTDCQSNGSGSLAIYINGVWNICNLSCLNPLSPGSGIQTPYRNQITWRWNPINDADGYKWSAINDFVNATDMGSNTTTTDTGLACNTSYTRYVWAYNVCGNSNPVTLTQSTLSCSSWVCGDSITLTHIAGNVAPVSKTVTYGTISNIPGEPSKCWITNNLGSSHQALAVNDTAEASAGWYWQFNRMQGYKHDGTTRTPGTGWEIIDEISDWTLANDPCAIELGPDWRIPTSIEWVNVDAGTSPAWTNWDGPWGSALKLHAAGDIYTSGSPLQNRGVKGLYWSSTQGIPISTSIAHNLTFTSSSCSVATTAKSFGYSVRCIHD